MARLIDANALLEKQYNSSPLKALQFAEMVVDVRDIKNAPTVDAVEVVRCRNCKYAKPYDRVDGLTGYYCQHPKNTLQYGTNWERLYEPIKGSSDFCSYGEKKEN